MHSNYFFENNLHKFKHLCTKYFFLNLEKLWAVTMTVLLGTIKSNLTIKQGMDTFLFSYCIFLIQKEIWLKLVIVPITYSLSYKNKNGKTLLSPHTHGIKLTYYVQKLFLYNMANFFFVQNTSLFFYLTILCFYL